MFGSAEKLFDHLACAWRLGAAPMDCADIFWRETKNVRVRLGLARHHPDQVYSLNTRFGRFYFRDNFGDITNLTNLIFHDVYGIRELAGPGVILDVGANIGLAAGWISHFNPGRPIYCFEPLSGNAAMVRKNCPHARVHDVAVASGVGEVALGVDTSSVMASSIPCSWRTTQQTFPTISLDGFVRSAGIKEIALLKIDAEGMELEILKGAREILPRIARVAMETHGVAAHENALDLLRRAKFQVDSAEFNGRTGMVFTSRSYGQAII